MQEPKGDVEDRPPGDVGAWLADFRTALIFLTRLPIAPPPGSSPSLAGAARAFGLAGAVVGILAAGIYYLLVTLGLPAGIATAVMLAAMVLLTGALHEDGLADTADGFGGGATPARRLDIMRDSHIGTYGVIALVLAFLLRWTALAHLAAVGGSGWLLAGVVIAVAAASRTAMAYVLHALPPARADGRGREAGRPGRFALWQAAVAAAAIFIAALWPVASLWAIVATALAGIVAAFAVVWLARRLIGGQTGDVCGSVQVVGEVTMLAAAATAIG